MRRPVSDHTALSSSGSFNLSSRSFFESLGPSRVMGVAAVQPDPNDLVNSWQSGPLKVSVFSVKQEGQVVKRDVNSTSHNPSGHVVDLTPADPTGELCYPGQSA